MNAWPPVPWRYWPKTEVLNAPSVPVCFQHDDEQVREELRLRIATWISGASMRRNLTCATRCSPPPLSEEEGFIEADPVLTRSTLKEPATTEPRVCGGEWFALFNHPSCSSNC